MTPETQERVAVEIAATLDAFRRLSLDHAELERQCSLAIAETEKVALDRVEPRASQSLAECAGARIEHLAERLAQRDDLAQSFSGRLGLDLCAANYFRAEFGQFAEPTVQQLLSHAAHSDFETSRFVFASAALRRRWTEFGPMTVAGGLLRSVWSLELEPIKTSLREALPSPPEPSANDKPVAPGPIASKVAALSLTVLERAFSAYWERGRTVQQVGNELVVVSRTRSIVARLKGGLAAAPDDAWLAASSRLTFHRLFRWMAAHAATLNATPEQQERRIEVRGGWARLAQDLGLKSGNSIREVRHGMDILAHLAVPLPDGTERALISYEIERAAPTRSARIQISLDDAWLPSYVTSFGKSPSGREARRLVPIPAEFPPLVGAARLHGAQAALELLVFIEFRKQARSVAGNEGAVIQPETWTRMLGRAGVPTYQGPAILEQWVGRAGPGSSPFIWVDDAEDPNRYVLADPFAREHFFITRSGRRETQGAMARKHAKRRSKAGGVGK